MDDGTGRSRLLRLLLLLLSVLSFTWCLRIFLFSAFFRDLLDCVWRAPATCVSSHSFLYLEQGRTGRLRSYGARLSGS